MHLHIQEHLRAYFHQYGYWTLLVALLLENAGLPVPGETALLLASFLAFSEHSLSLPWIIVVGICACTLGDNLGYAIGRYGGRPLIQHYQRLFRIKDEALARAEALIARYGAGSVFGARFVAGMRIIMGPLAGALRMRWNRFLLFNFLGAVAWVTVIAVVGYFFGSQWRLARRLVNRAGFALLAAGLLIALLVWLKRRRSAPAKPNG